MDDYDLCDDATGDDGDGDNDVPQLFSVLSKISRSLSPRSRILSSPFLLVFPSHIFTPPSFVSFIRMCLFEHSFSNVCPFGIPQ